MAVHPPHVPLGTGLLATAIVTLLGGCGDPAPPAPDASTLDVSAAPDTATQADIVSDTGADASTVDVPTVDVPVVDAPVVDVPVVDAPTVDVPRDAGAPCSTARDCDDREVCTSDSCASGSCRHDALPAGVDCGGTVPSACVAGVCTPGAELSLPLRTPACTMWSRVPPVQSYLAPVVTAEGLFAASPGWLKVMRRSDRWTMQAFPEPVGPGAWGFVAIVAGPAWIAAVGTNAEVTGVPPAGLGMVVVRQDGRWTDVTPEALRGLSLAGAWATGPVLYVATRGGRVFARVGTAWRELAGAVGVDGFGDPGALYLISRNVAGTTALSRYDGTRATAVPTPRIGEIRALAGRSGSEVYALGDRVYRATGTSLTAVPHVDCGSANLMSYERLVGAPGQLAVVGRCGTARRVFLREGDAWAAAGTLPTGLGAATYRFAVSADGQMHVTDNGRFWHYTAGAWTELPEDLAPPPSRPRFAAMSGTTSIVGPSYASISAFGTTWARLVGDRWEQQALPAGLSVKTAWAAPDGTIFAVSQGTMPGVWRYAAGSWTRDIAFSVTSSVPSSNIVGRSSSDVYVAYGLEAAQQIRHWNGAAWGTVPSPCGGGGSGQTGVARLALAGSETLLAYCSASALNVSPYQRDGSGGWSGVLPSVSAATRFGFIETLGPVASPSAILGLNNPGGYQLRTAGGWVERTFPAPHTGADATGNSFAFEVVPGSTPSRFVAVMNGPAPYLRTDGVTWTALSDPLARLPTASEDAWTDGRWVIAPTVFGSTSADPRDEAIQALRAAILRCDLGAPP
ncbi:MAG: hypothetical protein Q8S73_38790 [Deltaproteobacteria bacterium]|nr:hypothetical protein [Myxococcales bacterium]MDP3220113.1 hypothetical protein [Deltaproteobacteria bacterium]